MNCIFVCSFSVSIHKRWTLQHQSLFFGRSWRSSLLSRGHGGLSWWWLFIGIKPFNWRRCRWHHLGTRSHVGSLLRLSRWGGNTVALLFGWIGLPLLCHLGFLLQWHPPCLPWRSTPWWVVHNWVEFLIHLSVVVNDPLFLLGVHLAVHKTAVALKTTFYRSALAAMRHWWPV